MESFKKWKWSLFLAAAVLCIAGTAALVGPSVFMNILPILLGLTLVIVGCCELAYSVGIKEYTQPTSTKLVQGLVSASVGIVFLLKRDVSIVFLGVVLGLWAIISGSLRLALALRQCAAKYPSWRITILDALIKGIIGTFMMFNPFVGLAAWTMLIGVFLLSSGVSLFLWILYINKHLDFFDY